MKKVKLITSIVFLLLLSTSLEATYHKIGHCGGPGWSRDLAIVESTLLVPDSVGIHIIDVSEPDDPVYLSCLSMPENCLEIEVVDDIAYIANVSDGLLILDVTDPQSPQILGNCDTPDCALSLFVCDTLVYVADRNAGLQIIDVSNLQEPVIVGSYEYCHASDVRVYDSLAFIMSYNGAPRVIDVSDPTSPTPVTGIDNIPDDMNDLVIIDSIAYVARDNSFSIYDFSDPTVFDLISNCEQICAYKISISEDTAYLTGGYHGFTVMDISNIYNPDVVGVLHTPGCIDNAWISDDIAYTIDLYTGVEIYNISEPVNPNLIGYVDTPHLARAVAVSEDIAYIADNDSYIQILDISDPGVPYIINSYGIYFNVVDVIIDGNDGYVITDDRFYLFRLDDLVYPQVVSYIETGYTNNSIEFCDPYIYLSSLFDGLIILRINSSLDPYVVSSLDLPSSTYNTVVSDDIIYVANSNGMRIVDATDIQNIHEVSYLSTPSSVYSLSRKGDILYLSGNYDGIIVFDISDPINPACLHRIESHPDSRFITKPLIVNDRLIVEDRAWNELLIFDISEPDDPILLEVYSWNLSITDMIMYGDHLITTNGYGGVSILEIESCLSAGENPDTPNDFKLSSYPNPFNVFTLISFSIPKVSEVEVYIYNVKGQKVKSITNEIYPGGDHQVTWNGDDESGNNVGVGVYFYKLNVNGKTVTVKKCLLLK